MTPATLRLAEGLYVRTLGGSAVHVLRSASGRQAWCGSWARGLALRHEPAPEALCKRCLRSMA